MKGMMIPLEGGGKTVTFQFNPSELLGPTARAEYATLAVQGGDSPYMQFSHRREAVIQFDLIATRELSESDAKQMQQDLDSLTIPIKRGIGPAKPPKVMFIFGKLLREKCVVINVEPKFRRIFSPSLMADECRFRVELWRWKG
jgi:hypothetical protein